MKKDNVLLTASILGAVVCLATNFIFVKYLQCVGTALALLLAQFFVTTTYIIYVLRKKLVRIPFNVILESIFFAIPCVLLCIIFTYAIENAYLSLFVSFFLSTLLFVVINKKNIKKIL